MMVAVVTAAVLRNRIHAALFSICGQMDLIGAAGVCAIDELNLIVID